MAHIMKRRHYAEMFGPTVGDKIILGDTALVAEVEEVGPSEPLSMETLSPILSWYVADGWRAGCARCRRWSRRAS